MAFPDLSIPVSERGHVHGRRISPPLEGKLVKPPVSPPVFPVMMSLGRFSY
jgi:hypothetical protein